MIDIMGVWCVMVLCEMVCCCMVLCEMVCCCMVLCGGVVVWCCVEWCVVTWCCVECCVVCVLMFCGILFCLFTTLDLIFRTSEVHQPFNLSICSCSGNFFKTVVLEYLKVQMTYHQSLLYPSTVFYYFVNSRVC